MEQANKTHPILIAAGVAVLLFSLLGAAALTGFLPGAVSKSDPVGMVAPGSGAAPATPAQAQAQAQAPVRAAPRPAPVQKQLAQAPAVQNKTAAPCPSCGVIESVNAVQVKGEGSGLGAVAGGVAGAVIGNQFGHGNGRTVMTVAGAAGGAYAGNEVEKHVKKHTAYKVTVRMEDGTVRNLTQSTQPPFAIGDRVRINGNALERA
jgi:outer membrane lipoprotein SlyB